MARVIEVLDGRVRRRAALAVAVCLLVVGVEGCTTDSDDGTGGASTSSGSPSAATGTNSVSGPTGDLEDPKGAITALSRFTCEPGDGGGWSAQGKLTNTAAATTRFLVSVSVIKAKTSEVLGSAEKIYRLPPGGQRRVAFEDIYNRAGKGLDCVPRVVSGK